MESVYESCLVEELAKRHLAFRRQVAVLIVYKGKPIDYGHRADLIVENELLLELKSVVRLAPIHTSQVLTYLKLIDLHHGLIINFNVRRLSHGLKNFLR